MIAPPTILDSAAMNAAVLPLTIPREEIRLVMGPGLKEVFAALAGQGIAPAGPWFTHHLRRDPRIFDFEIGVPVEGSVSKVGRVRPGGLPARTVARTVYQGAYEGLADAWKAFHAWISERGHIPALDFWETYVVGPESSSDPSTWKTVLTQPLLDPTA